MEIGELLIISANMFAVVLVLVSMVFFALAIIHFVRRHQKKGKTQTKKALILVACGTTLWVSTNIIASFFYYDFSCSNLQSFRSAVGRERFGFKAKPESSRFAFMFSKDFKLNDRGLNISSQQFSSLKDANHFNQLSFIDLQQLQDSYLKTNPGETQTESYTLFYAFDIYNNTESDQIVFVEGWYTKIDSQWHKVKSYESDCSCSKCEKSSMQLTLKPGHNTLSGPISKGVSRLAPGEYRLLILTRNNFLEWSEKYHYDFEINIEKGTEY